MGPHGRAPPFLYPRPPNFAHRSPAMREVRLSSRSRAAPLEKGASLARAATRAKCDYLRAPWGNLDVRAHGSPMSLYVIRCIPVPLYVPPCPSHVLPFPSMSLHAPPCPPMSLRVPPSPPISINVLPRAPISFDLWSPPAQASRPDLCGYRAWPVGGRGAGTSAGGESRRGRRARRRGRRRTTTRTRRGARGVGGRGGGRGEDREEEEAMGGIKSRRKLWIRTPRIRTPRSRDQLTADRGSPILPRAE